MIFDTVTSPSAINWDAVQESAYPLGLEGGLMHVYENECNYNAIMKAAGISELKYYKECGGDLFVNEAAATGGFIDKFISFFKKVGEKIAQMFKKFVMTIGSFVQSDKNFVKKWKPHVFRNFKEFDFNGYKFDLSMVETIASKAYSIAVGKQDPAQLARDADAYPKSDDDMEAKRKEMMKDICGEDVDSDNELKNELHKKVYGENKEEFKVTSSLCLEAFSYISDTKKNIKDIQDFQKKFNAGIDKYCNSLEDAKKELLRYMEDSKSNKAKEAQANKMKTITQQITLTKDNAQYFTTAFSLFIGAFKDRNRQSKAICVKALNSGSRKKDATADEIGTNESATDIFANVEII